MRVSVKEIGNGQHPSEMIVQVLTKDGPTNLVIDKRAVKDNAIEIGYPIGKDGKYALIELPRETMRGEWRVWVPENEVLNEIEAIA